ncbi:MAG: c-type cytochrome domain-containing protein, partial [Acetobacteraceae bacterium]
LTHGSGYLTQYAPNFIRGMLGLTTSGPRLVTIAAADPYVDVISPVLEQRCSTCHNSNKQKGGLDMSSYASLMRGGGDGPVIVKGDAQDSDLIRRISLPQSARDYMPKGKSPLTANQIAVFRWWVDSGAKTGVKVLALNPPQNIQTIIQDELHPPAGGAAAGVAQQPNAAKNNAIEASARMIARKAKLAEAQPPKQADPRVIARLVAVGFMARPESLGDPHLVVSPAAPGSGFSVSAIQALAMDSSDPIVDLNLADSGLTDADVAPIAHLIALRHLRLDDNKLTDRSLQALSSLPKLVELNLYDNHGISDAGIPMLAAMKSLRRVYLWQTGVTKAGIAKLHKLRPHLEIDAGDMSVAPAAAPKNPDPPPGVTTKKRQV